MATLSLRDVGKAYGSFKAVSGVSLQVEQSEFVALLGPSGCGKTTLLRMIAGFVDPTEGRILIRDKDVTHEPPHKRNTGMVFQSYALFPHMTVAQNVSFGLKMRGIAEDATAKRCLEALDMVQMGHLAARFPRELSGGQQQRVAVARALVIRPDVFLLDEPLSNLDAKLRQSVGLEMRALQQSLGLTTVFVTHDQNEALALADRLVIMNEGQIVQTGDATSLYNRPASTFVANFLGRANLLPGRVEAGAVFRTDTGLTIACDTTAHSQGDRAVLCVRPENIDLSTGPAPANQFAARVHSQTYLGAHTETVVRLEGSATELIVHTQNRHQSPGGQVAAQPGPLRVSWAPESALLLPEQ